MRSLERDHDCSSIQTGNSQTIFYRKERQAYPVVNLTLNFACSPTCVTWLNRASISIRENHFLLISSNHRIIFHLVVVTFNVLCVDPH